LIAGARLQLKVSVVAEVYYFAFLQIHTLVLTIQVSLLSMVTFTGSINKIISFFQEMAENNSAIQSLEEAARKFG